MSLLDEIVGAHERVLRPSGGCHSCPRRKVDYVPADLHGGPVLFLGEAPSQNDVAAGTPFAGESGTLVRKLAQEYSVPGPWSFSYVTHCRPQGSEPNAREVNCCLAQYVLGEVKDYSVVALLGNTAIHAFFPGAKAHHFYGNVAWHPDFPGTRFYSMLSPGYVLRRPEAEDQLAWQMERLSRIARGEPKQDWTVVRGAAALAALKEMVKRPLLSIDWETNRLESWVEGGHIKSLAVTADAKTVAVAHRDEPHFMAMLKLIGQFLEDEGKSAVGSHVSFDLEWAERELGIRVKCQLIHDVGIQWYHAGQHKMPSLKELVSKHLDGYRYLIHQPHEMKDVDLLLMYNAEDVVHPIHLMRKAMGILKPRTRDLVLRVQGPADLVLQRMSANGMYLREDYRQSKIAEYREKRAEVIERWKAEDPEFIPKVHDSGDGLLHYLFTMRGLPIDDSQRTENGQPSTDKSVLKQYVRDGHSFVQHLLDLREIDKIDSTYLSGYDKFLWPDSRVRSGYPMTWTDSGRTSSRQPNLQNIPRKKEIRDLFGAPPGAVLLESDLSQIEFRIMVCLAGDRNGIEGYMRGEDAHTVTARRISGNPTPTKAQRSDAKPVNFGFLYGAHAGTVKQIAADDYGVIWSDEQAESFRTMFMQTYPAIPVFHDSSKQKLIKNRGWFESIVGHVFHYGEWDHRDRGKRDHVFRAALNAEAQGPAAQLCMYIMVLARRLLDERGFTSVKFVNHVHDSIMTEVPNPAWVEDVVKTIDDARGMAHHWVQSWFVVPLLMEHAAGESWGSLKEIKL